MRSGKGWMLVPPLLVIQEHCIHLSSPGLALPSHQVLNHISSCDLFPLQLCWHTAPEIDGGMAVEVEPSHQYSITFCCCMTDDSTDAVWQNGIWHESVDEAKVHQWIPSCEKKWHLLTFINAYQLFTEPNSGCEHSETMGCTFQQWWQQGER